MGGRFNPNEYEPVEDRIRRFWDDHAAGRILTDLVFRDDRQYIFRAEVFTDREDPRPAAVGYADEVIGSSPVNKTNALENAETSAIGRALANLNYCPKGARPSREEMDKAQRGQEQPRNIVPADVAKAALRKSCQENGWDLTVVADLFSRQQGTELKDVNDPIMVENFRKSLFAIPVEQLKASA